MLGSLAYVAGGHLRPCLDCKCHQAHVHLIQRPLQPPLKLVLGLGGVKFLHFFESQLLVCRLQLLKTFPLFLRKLRVACTLCFLRIDRFGHGLIVTSDELLIPHATDIHHVGQVGHSIHILVLRGVHHLLVLLEGLLLGVKRGG